MAEENNRHNVADRTYDCVLTGYVKRQEKTWGKDCSKHFILSVAVRPADDEDAEAYFAELPLVYKVGEDFGFYDKATNRNVVRKATSADTSAAIDYAKKVFPAWAEFIEQLPDNATMKDAFVWFTDGACKGSPCRAKLTNREYEDRNTHEMKIAHDAVLYAAGGNVSLDDFDKDFGASLKASGFKIGKIAKKVLKDCVSAKKLIKKAKDLEYDSVKANNEAKEATETALESFEELRKVVPNIPPIPRNEENYTGEDSWNAYEKNCIKNDPNGAKYWSLVSEVVGKDSADYESFTSDDWKKCVETWEGNF